jgi:PilZ domain
MEHRLGTRYALDLDVYLRTWGATVSATGRLKDLSVSGAFVATQLPCQPLLHVAVQVIPRGHSRRSCIPVEGLIVRVAADGIGVEWDELQPQLLTQFLLIRHSEEQLRTNASQCMQ